MDDNIFSVVVPIAGGIILLFIFFVLPLRKLPEEKGMKLLYQERCSVTWKYLGGWMAGGGMVSSRISFYEDFFVVSVTGNTKINYSEISALSCKGSWLLKSMTISLGNGRSLIISSRNIEKMQSIIIAKNKKLMTGDGVRRVMGSDLEI